MKINIDITLTKNTKITLAIFGGFIFALVLIPMTVVGFWMPGEIEDDFTKTTNDDTGSEFAPIFQLEPWEWQAGDFYITIHRDATDTLEEIEFERYIVGVVAAEMPALFERGALQAQAIAARTFAMRILAHEDYMLDTVMHQVFHDDDQLKERWGSDFERHLITIKEAVHSTRGLVLKYDDELITPMFFAMSNGATENSEDFFSSKRPYLRSVPSTGYELHEHFAMSETFTMEELQTAFDDAQIATNNITVIANSQGGNVSEIRLGNTIYTGREVRETLGLRSAAFSILVDSEKETITFTTYGHGHGVGMSQHGANVMARAGFTF